MLYVRCVLVAMCLLVVRCCLSLGVCVLFAAFGFVVGLVIGAW